MTILATSTRSAKTYTKPQAAEALGLPLKTIASLVKDGRLKTVDLPGMKRPRITQASIDEVFASIHGQAAKA
jgi:excisionase family DNA binding protein